MKTLVVLPSYNEKENINRLISAILSLSESFYVVVVDDNSPDGTFDAVEEARKLMPSVTQDRLHLVKRLAKDGRGGAVWDGMRWGLASELNFDSFVEMDCDFSHDPSEIKSGLLLIAQGYDLVLGSRYPDGKILNWPLKRRIFSRVANFLCRILISLKFHDYTNGYRFYNRKAAMHLSQSSTLFKGYINLSETLAKLLKHKFSIGAFPIVFENRKLGKSNTDLKEMLGSFFAIFQIAARYWFDRRF
jgi:dolichol-phosphate mannosyltransferase|tara:strand:+ start:2408 stop:3145 length:738 start_codon:yes stop_codon:yes gene_type:complete